MLKLRDGYTSKLSADKRSIKYLTGRIPTELGHCSAMNRLSLARNRLSGTSTLCSTYPVWYTIVYQTGQDEHKIGVPVNLFLRSWRSLIALQRPSSFGFAECLLVRSINLSKKVLTGQFVDVHPETRHSRALPELRRNVACAARRSLLVYSFTKQGKMSTKLTYRSAGYTRERVD